MKIGLVSPSPTRWDAPWQMRQQLLTRLPDPFRVVWMEPPHGRDGLFRSRRPVLRKPDPERWPNLTVYTPPAWLPKMYRPGWLGDLTERARLRQASSHLRSRGCERLVLYLWRPDSELLAAGDGFDLTVYHAHDEYSFSADDPPTPREEMAVLEAVDQVVVHSPTLMDKKGHVNPHTTLLPNGVDFDLYQGERPEPPMLADVPNPRVGYTGFLKRQLDWDLIRRLVDEHPRVSFVFVGPTQDHEGLAETLRELGSRPNVFLPGERPHTELPAWVQHFDVCVMPYRNDGYTRYIYPLKLHEYLATGRPIVATDLPNLRPFADVLALADGFEAWSRALSAALAEGPSAEARTAARKRVARRHDWATLASTLGEQLIARLGGDTGHALEAATGDTVR